MKVEHSSGTSALSDQHLVLRHHLFIGITIDVQNDTKKRPEVAPDAFRVMLTGFGPFMHYTENPSWLAVKPLQNVVLQTGVLPDNTPQPSFSTTSSIPTSSSNITPISQGPSTPRPIHITTLQIPVLYHAVLDIVPGLHARPPILPPDASEECAEPPDNAYDFIFHIGVAGRGPLRMERLGHKYGYHMKDASGKLAPVVRVSPKDFTRHEGPSVSVDGVGVGTLSPPISAAESMERERLGMDMTESSGDTMVRPTRGFGVNYENFQEEYTTHIDVTRLVQDLKRSGVEQIYTSMDAGHYLCDFIYYCSLAEVKRSSKPYEKRRNTQVLFLHCPPVGQPLTTKEVTDAIKKIIIWVCSEQQIDDERDDAVVAAG
ncbi:unnamed protein product [Cyclocybe aegerita]|uniref:Peptidase C15, pyroglutamyl peptidase I-like protein n=1 Tax=Cyclocybe aegerita TaxID=1973307 RepID=A0A8S0W582_CYCAE|nr:unnamed protein product [Cyclocybe aegerita]